MYIGKLVDLALDAAEKKAEREASMTTEEKMLREMKKANSIRQFYSLMASMNNSTNLYRR